jgi:hypothetical protein
MILPTKESDNKAVVRDNLRVDVQYSLVPSLRSYGDALEAIYRLREYILNHNRVAPSGKLEREELEEILGMLIELSIQYRNGG